MKEKEKKVEWMVTSLCKSFNEM